ncbi:Tiny macrocysts protein B, partial [Tetrabaena socialis]
MMHAWLHGSGEPKCFTMPHVVHVVVAVASSITFAVAALLLIIADHELEPLSRNLLAAPHSMTELKAQLAKTVITVVDVLLWKFQSVQGLVYAICTVASFYYHLKELPYYTVWMNSFRLCFFAVHAWVGVHLCILMFTVDSVKVQSGNMGFAVWETANYDTAKRITDSMAYGIPAVFFGAGLAGAIRLYYFFRITLKFQVLQQQPNLYSKRVHRFADEKEVEICTRITRVWDEDGVVDPACLDLAETVVRAGIQQFPKSPFLHIVYANLLIDCRENYQSGWAQLEEARRMPLNLSYRFSIFTREQQHKQKAAAVSSSGENASDLVSYVEFQRNYKLIQSYHKAALVAMREFWQLLLHDAVNLNSLTSAFRKIEQMEHLADRTYKVVLERYPKAVKLLRSYANFLETVKNDPWTAAQFNSEADKQEEALENAENDLGGEDALSMRNSAIITINAEGIIHMANKHAVRMMGYGKGELDGKNISCIMPQPFSGRHNSYMRNYRATGKAKILDSPREVVALHRDHYVFPIKILVTKTQGNGADALFMGLLKEVEADPTQIKAWLMPNGMTLCADQSFTDYAGWAPADLIGKPFTGITADPDFVSSLIERAASCAPPETPQRQLGYQITQRRNSNTKQAYAANDLRSAVMQVLAPEHTAEGTHYTVRLWRPELLSGVMELNNKMVVTKADPVAGLIFGTPAHALSQQPLSRFLKVEKAGAPPGKGSAMPASLAASRAASFAAASYAAAAAAAGGHQHQLSMEYLLGNKNVKGGMKGKAAHKTGPRRVFEARHADGMALQISCQVALKGGSSTTRLVALLKPLNLITGNVAVLHALMRGQDMDGKSEGASSSLHRIRTANAAAARAKLDSSAHSGTHGAAGAGRGGVGSGVGVAGGPPRVPRLSLSNLGKQGGGGGGGGSGVRMSSATTATAQGVELE